MTARVVLLLVRRSENLYDVEKYTYMRGAKCMNIYLVRSLGPQFIATLDNVSILPSPDPD